MRGSAALDARGLRKSYGAHVAVNDVDLRVERGEIHGLLGANGAGKTTLLRLLLGLVRPDGGTVRLLDGDRTVHGTALPRGVAGYVDVPGFYPYLTGRQNLRLLARLDDEAKADIDRVDEALASVGLEDKADVRVRAYSAGMRQRLALAATLLRRPQLLMLDEPTSSLDPTSARNVRARVRDLAAGGSAIVLSSHDMAEVEELCSAVTVLREGRVVFSGSIGALRERSVGAVFRLHTSEDESARVLGEHEDVHVRRAEGRGLEVVSRTSHIDGYAVALGRAGIAIRHLQREETSLEELFVRLTSEARPAREASSPDGSSVVEPGTVAQRASRARTPVVTARGLRATLSVECAKVAGSWAARGVLTVAAVAPFLFALAMKVQTTLPDDTLFGRWAATSGFALPLVVLGFAASWVFPVLASIVGGDIFSAEDRDRTWATLLTRSRTRGEILGGKVIAALGFSTLAVVVLGLASVVAGALIVGRQPLIGLSGTELPAGVALARVTLAWLSVLPPALGFTSLALLVSVTTRSGLAGVGLPILIGLVLELASLVDGADGLRPFALTAPFVAWHGLFAEPRFYAPLRHGLAVSAAYALACLIAAGVAFSRLDTER